MFVFHTDRVVCVCVCVACRVSCVGSDDILDMITRLLSPKVILTSTPTFGMYSFLAKVAAARVIDVPRKVPQHHTRAQGWRTAHTAQMCSYLVNDAQPHTFDLDVDAIVASIRENAVPLVFIPSPNNPTGTQNCTRTRNTLG